MADPVSTRPDRREGLQGTASAATAVGADEPARTTSSPIDFTRQSAALQPDRVVTSACQFCNSLCGLKVHLKAGRIIDIKGVTDDPVQAGELCVKGPMMAQLIYNRQQLNGVRLIQVHPRTAAKAGLENGDAVVVESPRGSVAGTVLLWEGIRQDTVFVPNTFGPAHAEGDEFGLPRYEAANQLTDDRYFDNLSGQQAYKCFACRLKKPK